MMHLLTRREMLHLTGVGAASLLVGACNRAEANKADQTRIDSATYPFTLPKLPYPNDALEKAIDAKTMEIHHDRHHQAYVTNLNNALKPHTDLHKTTLVELVKGYAKLPRAIQAAVRNNGGGHYNHSLFWQMMAKEGGKPSGDLAKALDAAFGSFEKFTTAFNTAAVTRFGSGWAWLVLDKGKLAVLSTANQDNPITGGKTPLLGIDVWEHAYYLRYQNKRPDYVKAWWDVVNWKYVSDAFAGAKA